MIMKKEDKPHPIKILKNKLIFNSTLHLITLNIEAYKYKIPDIKPQKQQTRTVN
jgi:hypothetical protein